MAVWIVRDRCLPGPAAHPPARRHEMCRRGIDDTMAADRDHGNYATCQRWNGPVPDISTSVLPTSAVVR